MSSGVPSAATSGNEPNIDIVRSKKEGEVPSFTSTRRLLRDLHELAQEPLPGVTITVTETNIFCMIVTLTPQEGPLHGQSFDMELRFPCKYPAEPPNLRLLTDDLSGHPNVYGRWVCLNMLRGGHIRGFDTVSSGWSPAYSLSSILMQLQSFLFAENVPQDDGDTAENLLVMQVPKRVSTFALCELLDGVSTHETSSPTLEACDVPSSTSSCKSAVALPEIPSPLWNDLPDELLLKICESLVAMSDLSALFRTCKRLYALAIEHCVWVRRGLRCFYHRAWFTEDVLGCGLFVERHSRSGGLKSVTLHVDMLSRSAYFHNNVRRNPFNGEAYNEWLPLLLSPPHARQALPLVQASLARVASAAGRSVVDPEAPPRGGPMDGRDDFKPWHTLEVLPKLMNQMVVSFMQSSASGEPGLASERALKAFCACHHLLLRLAAEHPELVDAADYWTGEFCKHDSRRNKAVIHDLGELLTLLTISSKCNWEDLGEAFVREAMCRNARWYLLGGHPELAVIEPGPDSAYRLRRTFEMTQVSRQLLMFQEPPAQILEHYDRSYGHPRVGMAARLQQACRQMSAVDSWEGYLEHLGVMRGAGQAAVSAMLRESVQLSEKRGYHKREDVLRRIGDHTKTWDDLCELRRKKDPQMASEGGIPKAASPVAPAAARSTPSSPVARQLSAGSIRQLVCAVREKSHKTTDLRKIGNITPKPRKLFVAGLPFRVSDANLQHAYMPFGEVTEAKVVKDASTGKSRGFGFVTFKDPECAAAAKEHTNGSVLDNRKVKVDFAR
ncbi:hypothetical protein CYMTET_28216 [Cymbomonas tetramitiformis]|uniref:Uncharacterized protein n=1 Tax=Cymbomonas tetramitiformis TaxID=36881 RepID=A0AAE0FN96_9CHLO|nr:hypothetical protein CYMTET_28216 [Cymbomonas tetramitiformis]